MSCSNVCKYKFLTTHDHLHVFRDVGGQFETKAVLPDSRSLWSIFDYCGNPGRHALCAPQHVFTILISARLPVLEHLIGRSSAETF